MSQNPLNWNRIENYFKDPFTGFLEGLFKNAQYPWSPLSFLEQSIESFFTGKIPQGELLAECKDLDFESSYFVTRTQVLKEDFIDPKRKVFIGRGTYVEAGSTIKNHSLIDLKCEIRQGAYIRGFCYVGPESVVGHATEMKNSIFIRHVEAGHFAYIGNSIVGSYVNLGAGTKISNLQFRNFEDKKKIRFPEIPFYAENSQVPTGLSKMGAIVGDGCETGCNAVLSPFVLLEPECWILPNLCVPKGIYPKGSLLKTFEDCREKRR